MCFSHLSSFPARAGERPGHTLMSLFKNLTRTHALKLHGGGVCTLGSKSNLSIKIFNSPSPHPFKGGGWSWRVSSPFSAFSQAPSTRSALISSPYTLPFKRHRDFADALSSGKSITTATSPACLFALAPKISFLLMIRPLSPGEKSCTLLGAASGSKPGRRRRKEGSSAGV